MKKWLYCGWGLLYIISVALGLIPEATGVTKAALMIFSVIFFVPGFLLLWEAIHTNDRKNILAVRWISLTSLTLTMVTLVVFFLFAAQNNEAAVDVAYEVLALVSAPMLCARHWIISLFLWACLLSGSFAKKKTPGKTAL